MKEAKTVQGFVFQAIPMKEALTIVRAGDGNYSEIKEMLLEKLPELDLLPEGERQAFSFGFPKGKEVPMQGRRGMTMALRAVLKKAGVDWRITYSQTHKIFVCVPRSLLKNGSKPQVKPTPVRTAQTHDALVPFNGTNIEKFILLAAHVFHVDSKALVGNIKDQASHDMQKAIAIVGKEKCHYSSPALERALGHARSWTNYMVTKGTRSPDTQSYIERLSRAVDSHV